MIRQATIEDLPRLMDLAEKFASTVPEMALFDREIAINSWTQFLDLKLGCVFMLKDYSGMLAALVHPDPYTGELMAQEMAWFVEPGKRGGGIRLLIEFERWAKEVGCKRIILAYLLTGQSDALKKLYDRRGYVPREIHYVKDI